MRSACKSMAMVGFLIGTLLAAACHRERGAGTAASSAGQNEAPPAIRYEDHVFAGGIPPPGSDLPNPHTGSAQSAQEGQALFSGMNCDGCHSSDGSGAVGPSLTDGRWRYGGRDEEIFNSIFYGRPKGMPAYGGLLGQGGAWSLVDYLKSLPKPDSVPTLSFVEPQAGEGHPGQEGTTGASTQ